MFGRIVLFCYNIYFKYAKKRFLKKRNFTYLESLYDEAPAAKNDIIAVLDKFKQNDFDGFQKDFTAMHQNDEILSAGRLKSSLVFESLVSLIYSFDMIEAQNCLIALDKWWQSDKTAFASGLYGYVLYHRGWSKRGGGYIHEVTEAGMQDYDDYLTKAANVLEDCQEATDKCYIWNLANYNIHRDGGVTKQELGEYFEKVVRLNPNNIWFYASYAFRLMPRWFGHSMQDVDDFARLAIEKTKDQFGAGVYAAIYYVQATIAENPFEESCCDLDLLEQGFEDLYQRFGGQACVNYHLMTLQWAFAHKRAYPIVENRLTAIIPDIWVDEEMGDRTEYANLAIAMIGLKIFELFEDDEEK